MAWQDELEGANRDAAAALIALFESYGLGTLAPKIVEYLQDGYEGSTITVLLQNTNEYKQRFAANEARKAKNLPILDPQEYLQTERAYAQAMQATGMPAGFYDDPASDFRTFLEKDIAPTEIADRANKARQRVNTIDPEQRGVLQRQLGLDTGDLAAYFLNVDKALPILEKTIESTLLGGERERAGYGFSQTQADALYSAGLSIEEARQGYGIINEMEPTFTKLGDIDDVDFDVSDAEAEVFGNSGEAATKRKGLASRERARFSGAAGTGSRTLERERTFNT